MHALTMLRFFCIVAILFVIEVLEHCMQISDRRDIFKRFILHSVAWKTCKLFCKFYKHFESDHSCYFSNLKPGPSLLSISNYE